VVYKTGLSPLGVPGVPLADQLTLSQTVGADYVNHINTGTPGFSDLPTALKHKSKSRHAKKSHTTAIITQKTYKKKFIIPILFSVK
jgi:hypothetical protein